MSRCRICDTKLTNKELSAKDHRTLDYLNTCNTCKNVTNEQHGGRKCPDCDERFNTSSRYHFHINKHTGLKYSCIKCGKEFFYKANLTTHTNIHLGIKPYHCSTCEKSFSDRSACMRHEKLHSRVGKFETFCSVCGKGLAMAGRLEEHTKTHGGRKFSQEEKV